MIAKSSVVLDCKPWDDETDMKEMERLVRSIQKDGLVWGAGKFLVKEASAVRMLFSYHLLCTMSIPRISQQCTIV